MNRAQIETRASRIDDPEDRAAFEQFMTDANWRAKQAADLRKAGWEIYRASTGLKKGQKWCRYA